ncbi:polysaccharide pyruvyl transferase family protein [Devosia sp.]|uniref:polysaccharide pyruvyl transferase family protein n=1 Tax=Devosia sp. TaxID=1871048 RepID=UPI003BAB4B65
MTIKQLIKKVVPTSALAGMRQWNAERMVARVHADWDEAKLRLRTRAVSQPVRRLLIVPGDPSTLTGSLGDDAMISACVDVARAHGPDVAIHTLTSTSAASQQASIRGYIPEQIWSDGDFPGAIAKLLDRQKFDVVAALGADILDGYYDPVSATKTLAVCDLAARAGVPTTVLGFSLNASPSPLMRPGFDRLHDEVRLNVRDAISLRRFKAFCGRKANLVTDAAFCLTPGEPPSDTARWVAEARASGRKVIGLNVHPMLIKDASVLQIEQIIAVMSQTLRRVSERRSVAWLLLPHDYREEKRDARCLAPIAANLSSGNDNVVRLLEGEHTASVLKAIAGLLDGVVTGRMHLAVAALGMSVPALSITYQGKFEGLYEHFDLPDWLLVQPQDLLHSELLEQRIIRFIDETESLSATVRFHLPMLMAMSRENFAVFG